MLAKFELLQLLPLISYIDWSWHFNENSNRDPTKEGKEQFSIVFPKYKKEGHIVRSVDMSNVMYRRMLLFWIYYCSLQEIWKKTMELCA